MNEEDWLESFYPSLPPKLICTGTGGGFKLFSIKGDDIPSAEWPEPVLYYDLDLRAADE